ncbi:MAG: alkaline phosphatase family protein [Candidatus Brocadiia bacterium]
MIFGFGKTKRVIGIGLDGFPYSLAEQMIDEDVMPNLRRLAERGTMKRIKSVFPTVSGVAWSSFQTGKNPGEFGVYGFVELTRDFDLTIPNHTDLKCETLWHRLEDAGKRFAALGVPMTYPTPKLEGFMVSGFLAPELDERAVSNPGVLETLKQHNYEIDIDPGVAIDSPMQFKEDLKRVSEARQETALSLLGQEEEWDLFFLHVMDTDRINHFLWKGRRGSEAGEDGFFWDFYGKLDEFLGRVVETVEDDAEILICSDHGFCELKWEVQLNRWLKNQGYLDYENDPAQGYKAIKPGSRAVSLVPGRIHILREEQWDAGCVSDKEYEPLRKEMMDKLRAVRHPETGDVVCKQVMKKEEVFKGPHVDDAPDIIVDPCDGYDLKAKLGVGHLFEKGPRSGMHTYEDAMLLTGSGLRDVSKAETITEVGRLIAKRVL